MLCSCTLACPRDAASRMPGRLPCCPPAQEWASFGDYVTEVINSVDAERISEVEAEKRLVPAVVYQVRLCLSPCTALKLLGCIHWTAGQQAGAWLAFSAPVGLALHLAAAADVADHSATLLPWQTTLHTIHGA